MEPKAKWKVYDPAVPHVWSAVVGPFYLEVDRFNGYAEICEYGADDIGARLWHEQFQTPQDAADLMHLTEAELARRLEHAAGTMDGRELVAERCPNRGASIRADYQTNSYGISRSAMAPGRPGQRAAFDIGDEVYATDVAGKVHRGFIAPSTVTGCYLVKTTDAVGYFSEKSLEMVRRVGDVEDSPRFKVGDLVRSKEHGRLGVVDSLNVPFVAVRFPNTAVGSGGFEQVYDVEFEPYVLPPINSYADLAAVLDELPEGWRVEQEFLVYGEAAQKRLYWRSLPGTFRCRSGSFTCEWNKDLVGHHFYAGGLHRVLPPESGE